jgi:hypothetical protein
MQLHKMVEHKLSQWQNHAELNVRYMKLTDRLVKVEQVRYPTGVEKVRCYWDDTGYLEVSPEFWASIQ